MVYVRDDGVFDASIEKIWKYIQDPESHLHESILSQKVLEQKGNTMKIRAEIAGPKGKAEEIWQMRMDPPFGFELQVLEGRRRARSRAIPTCRWATRRRSSSPGTSISKARATRTRGRAPSRTSSRFSTRIARP